MQTSRREMLKQLAVGTGLVGLSPWTSQLRAQSSSSQAKPPMRFVFVSRANGLRPYGVQPVGLEDQLKGSSKVAVRALKSLELHETMRSLDKYKTRLNIIQGLSAHMCRGVHTASYGALGANASDNSPLGPTIDHVLSEAFPSAFTHLRLCAAGNPERYVADPHLSAAGPNLPLMSYCNPAGAYRDIFGALVGGEKFQAEADLKRSLLKFVADDLRRLDGKLSSEEQIKLGYYSDGVKALRLRQERIAGLGAAARANVPKFSDIYTSGLPEDCLQAHFDMAAAALITGLTRVITMSLDSLGTNYRKLGIDVELHSVGHAEMNPARGAGLKMTGVEACHRIRKLHFELIAGLAAKLDAVPEADGTMLDNTAIIFLSEAASTHHAGYSRFPLVVIGGLNGRLRTGAHIQYPDHNKPGNRTIGNFYTTLLHAAGMPQDGFGHPDSRLPKADQKQPLSELLAK